MEKFIVAREQQNRVRIFKIKELGWEVSSGALRVNTGHGDTLHFPDVCENGLEEQKKFLEWFEKKMLDFLKGSSGNFFISREDLKENFKQYCKTKQAMKTGYYD